MRDTRTAAERASVAWHRTNRVLAWMIMFWIVWLTFYGASAMVGIRWDETRLTVGPKEEPYIIERVPPGCMPEGKQ